MSPTGKEYWLLKILAIADLHGDLPDIEAYLNDTDVVHLRDFVFFNQIVQPPLAGRPNLPSG